MALAVCVVLLQHVSVAMSMDQVLASYSARRPPSLLSAFDLER